MIDKTALDRALESLKMLKWIGLEHTINMKRKSKYGTRYLYKLCKTLEQGLGKLNYMDQIELICGICWFLHWYSPDSQMNYFFEV
jgi:hypothetical protein